MIIIISLFVYFNTKSNGILIKVFDYSFLTVGSGSMLPELAVGDVIIIKECDEYKINDIITYSVDNEYLITHRIIDRNGNRFVTKGDNNNTTDKEIVTKDNIEGKVIYNSRLLKMIYNNWIIAIVIIFLVLIIW